MPFLHLMAMQESVPWEFSKRRDRVRDGDDGMGDGIGFHAVEKASV